jgi:ubiquinone/menaquinone biosynthesis C-methylase UbiE
MPTASARVTSDGVGVNLPRVVDTYLMTGAGWEWDPTLYAGSAAYYAQGRVSYPAALADALALELGLDGRGRLLDVGCGPGSLTLLLAPRFEHATGVDADPQMLAEGERLALAAGIVNVDWVHRKAEDLSLDLGTFRVATLAQSFHWMDRKRVAGIVRRLLTADGAVAHVHATTHQGVDDDIALPHPKPPRREIEAVVREFLGTRRRAGQGHRAEVGSESDRGRDEAQIYQAAGFVRPTRIEVPGQVVTRTVDQVVASVFSLSYAAPHLFGNRAATFEQQLRMLLADVSPDGQFSEQMREIAVDVWRV